MVAAITDAFVQGLPDVPAKSAIQHLFDIYFADFKSGLLGGIADKAYLS